MRKVARGRGRSTNVINMALMYETIKKFLTIKKQNGLFALSLGKILSECTNTINHSMEKSLTET